MTCPQCGAVLGLVRAQDGGVVSEVRIEPIGMALVRRARPASFWACSTCEYCEEVSPCIK